MQSFLSEADFAVNISRVFLRAVGVWPNTECSRVYALVSNFIFIISSILIIYFIVIAQTSKIFLVGGDLDTIVDIMCTADIPVFVALIKMAVLRYDSEVLKLLLRQMSDDWQMPHSHEQIAVMRSSSRSGRKIATTCVGLAYGTSNVFLFLRLILLRQRQMRTGERAFLFESYFPVDVSDTPWFEITWIIQGFCTFSATTAYSAIDGFFCVLILHLCGQLTILKNELATLVNKRKGGIEKNEVREDLARMVKRHNELNRFAKTIEEIFNRMFLAQILACILQFCLQGYEIIIIIVDTSTEFPVLQLIFMVMYICYMSLDLYIYCYVAEKLRKESIELSNAVYSCKWYNLKPKEAFDLMFIIKRAQYPLEITAGKFSSLSLRLFSVIGKTSLGYLSMLLAVKERTLKAAKN